MLSRTAIFISLLLISTIAGADGLVSVQQTVFGMDCAPCAYGMQKGLDKLPGVAKVDVSLETGVASVQFNPDSSATLAQVRDVVLHGGFTADKTQLSLQGTVSLAEGRILLDDGTLEKYELRGLSPAQTAALKPGSRVEVQGQVQSAAEGAPVVLMVSDLKAATPPTGRGSPR